MLELSNYAQIAREQSAHPYIRVIQTDIVIQTENYTSAIATFNDGAIVEIESETKDNYSVEQIYTEKFIKTADKIIYE